MNNITNLDITELSTKTGYGRKYKFENISFKTLKNLTNVSSGSYTIVALYEGRAKDKGQIGMACIDLRYSELNLCQFMDTNSYTLLKIRLSLCEPIEIVLPEGGGDKISDNEVLADMLRNAYEGVQLCAIHRKFFNDSRGIELVKQLSVVECSNIDVSVLSKYYCMAAAAALIKYVEHIQNVLFAQHSLKIVYEAIDDSCLIDVNSWSNLELIRFDRKSNQPKIENESLFDIINCCVTNGGMRTLRSCLLQPCADPDVINIRLDVVEELINNQAMLERFRTIMSSLNDMQQLITLCVHVNLNSNSTREDSIRAIRNKISKCIDLKKLLVVVKQLSGSLMQAKNPFFFKNRKRFEDTRLDEISQIVDAKIDTTASTRKRKSSLTERDAILFAVTPGQHVLLDLARRAYEELRGHIFQLENEEYSGVPNAEIVFNLSRGYHFNLSHNDPFNVRLPSHCIQVVRNRASVSFTTRDLIKYNDRLVQSENEILLKSNMVLDQLISAIRAYLPALYNCVELISLLDFFSAMACYSNKTKTVRPIFGTQLIIRQGRHPILDIKHEAVPNDTYAVPEARFSVIAGPNMAGKSTYMQQVCLLQILSQCGCFVPADFACFVPMNRIFSRIGYNDDLGQGLSGFAVEMSEMAVILQNANHRSLIIVDELARSTSTEEGIGMSYAICEELIKSKAFVFFATHFLDLSFLELNYPVVRNFHLSFEMNENDEDHVFKTTHIFEKGRYKGPLYGLELAELTTLPDIVVKNSRALAERLRANAVDVENSQTAPEIAEIVKKKKLSYLAYRLIDIIKNASSVSDAVLSTQLKHLQITEASNKLF